MRNPFGNYWQLLRQYLAPQRRAALLMVVSLFSSIGLQLAGPQIVRSFIDAARRGVSEAILIQVALVFISVSIVQQVMNVLATYWSERVAWTATNALRADLAAHLVRLDLGFHKTHTPGELIERVDGDVNTLAGIFSSFVVQLVGSLLLLIGVVVAIYFVDIRLGIAFTAFAVLALWLLRWVRQFGIAHWQADREQSASFYGYIGEMLTATEDIRSCGAVAYALRRFFEHLRAWMPVRLRAELRSGTVWMTAAAIFAFGDSIAYGLGGGLYRVEAISLGAVYLVVAYTAMLAEPIETIRTQLQDLQRADAGVLRVRELLETSSRLEDGSESLPSGALSVEFHHVHFGYEEEQASVLEDVSFTIEPGHLLGLLGQTGSGKTTIARLLFRLYDPRQGEVRLGGVNLRHARMKSIRSQIGMVTQDVQLFEASLRDNITFFAPDITDVHLLAVLETLGLKPWLDRLPHGLDTLLTGASLSAGEAQLLALARIFIKDPGLVILDEASSRLDPASEALLEHALAKLLEGRTVLIIAHRLATVERADEILILERGRVLEYGSREKLAADPQSRYTELRHVGHAEVLV